MLTSKIKTLKIGYAAGPGDIVGTYKNWIKGQRDPNEVSETYSGQFYDLVKAINCNALVIASHPRSELVEDGQFSLEHFPKTTKGKRGLSFHFFEIRYWLNVMWKIRRSGCNVAVISGMEHWWLLSFLRVSGVKIIPSLHCAFWPKGFRPTGVKDRIIQALNGWFWRNVPSATISISPECERQVRTVAGMGVKGALLQARAFYKAEYFQAVQAADWSIKPFRILYAGRIEENKGVFDLVEVMRRLTQESRIDIRLDVCGDGSALSSLRERVERAGLEHVIALRGKLRQKEMMDVIQTACVFIVPTTAGFSEGMNKVVVEGVLSSRPVIATSVCHANDVFPRSVIEVAPGDISAMAVQIMRLATDAALYKEVCAHGQEEVQPFLNKDSSWGCVVGVAIGLALN